MLEDLEFDDAGSPAIGLVPSGVSWQQVHDHIKIAHHHLLMPSADGGDYTGAYWTGTEMALVERPRLRRRKKRSTSSAPSCQEHDET